MGFVDARTLRDGHRIEADVCIIGSGAAGLAIARSFFGSSKKVALLESGGEEPAPETQSLYEGRSIGQAHASLASSRLRYFGGTTNHWTAHVRTLDPIDFEQRPWVPHSGWPFTMEELAPYYELARVFLLLPPRPFDPARWAQGNLRPWSFEDKGVETKVRQVVPERNRRLGPRLRDKIALSRNVDTYLYANVLSIDLAEGRKKIRSLTVKTLAGTRLTANARVYVLATGGIENPRILLLSDIGTSPDLRKNLVGRYFANHPATDIAEIQLDSRQPGPAYYHGEEHRAGKALPLLSFSADRQRRFRLLNTWLQLLGRLRYPEQSPHRDSNLDAEVAELALDIDGLESGKPVGNRQPGRRMVVRAITEQAPNPESRVLLGDKKDRLGQRRAILDWQLTELDSQSAHQSVDLLTREMGIAGIGRVRSVFPERGFPAVDARGSFHHMGTTRMHRDPTRGVVDENCRVHGVSNLYIAGSSVFPTTGTSNPTFTILALAFRLAEYLKEQG